MPERDRVFRRKGSKCWYCWVPKPGGGVRAQTTHCTDRRAAVARAAELERLAVDPTYAAETSTTTDRIMTDYLAHLKRQRRADQTIAFYTKLFGTISRLLLVEGVGAAGASRTYPLTRGLDHGALCAFVDARQAEGVMNTTALKELRALGAAWTLARKAKLVHCAWDEIVPQLDDDHVDRERACTPWEIVGFAMVLPVHRAAWVAFVAATGCDDSASFRALPGDVAVDRSMVHIRGTKRATRDRDVPVPLAEQRALLDWAMANADGGIGGRLFSAWPNRRNDLAKACERLGLARVSPNDLRRTFGNWLSEEGVEASLIGPAMGHIDSRMAERVYAKLRGKRLAKAMRLRLLGIAAGTESHMRAEAAGIGLEGPAQANGKAAETDAVTDTFEVLGDGIEPPTRGFSISDRAFRTPAKVAENGSDCTPNESESAPEGEPPSPRRRRADRSGDRLLPPGFVATRIEGPGPVSVRVVPRPGECAVAFGRVVQGVAGRLGPELADAELTRRLRAAADDLARAS